MFQNGQAELGNKLKRRVAVCKSIGLFVPTGRINVSHRKPLEVSGTDGKVVDDEGLEHKAKTVTGLTGGIEGLLKKYKVDYFKGKGEILKAGSVKVTPIEGGEAATLDTKNIVIASGSVRASPRRRPRPDPA